MVTSVQVVDNVTADVHRLAINRNVWVLRPINRFICLNIILSASARSGVPFVDVSCYACIADKIGNREVLI